MRRLMMEIAQRIAEEKDIQALVTGESVGQVASQTMGAIVCTDAAITFNSVSVTAFAISGSKSYEA